MKLNNKKSGFTLAEVLVTLMIIGVIAAMTIPSLMQSTAQQEYKAAFKKAVSMLNQAVTLNYALDGRDASDYTGTGLFDLLTQRLNVMSSTDGSDLYTADGMWFSLAEPKASGSKPGLGVTEAKACSATVDDVNNPDNVCSVVYIDVNGQKGPNSWTEGGSKIKDIFSVAVYPQKALPNGTAFSEALYSK